MHRRDSSKRNLKDVPAPEVTRAKDGTMIDKQKEEKRREEIQKYLDFLYDEKNIGQCKNCPENKEFSRGDDGNVLPCGQYHCWMSVHCGRC